MRHVPGAGQHSQGPGRKFPAPACACGPVAVCGKGRGQAFYGFRQGHLRALAGIFKACEPFTAQSLEAALNAYVADKGLKFKEVAPPLRTALMGFMGGSHLNEIMAFLGREETLARLERAAA